MNAKMILKWLPLVAVCLISGCATSSGVIVTAGAPKTSYHSAYLVVHGDKSVDMDTNIQKELLRRGFNVNVGSEGAEPPNTDLVVRYTDDWKWDLSMYLRAFDLMVFDGKSKVLLASGSWKNSALHGYHNAEKVVGDVVGQTLGKLNPGT